MLKTLGAYVQTVHAVLILWLTLKIYKFPASEIQFEQAVAELALTIISTFVIQRKFDLVPVVLSLSLFYTQLPEELHLIAILFLGKILYVNYALANAKNLLFSGDNCDFCQVGGVIYDFIRFTVVQYLFLGIVIMVYKIVVITYDKSGQNLPQNYVLFYQMIVTATTIGYGDVCPKSRIQMMFFIGAIPFICGSFVIYGNHVNPLWETVLAFLNKSPSSGSKKQAKNKFMNDQELKNMSEFAKLSAERKAQLQSLHRDHFDNWISIAAINYQKQAELIHTIVDSSFQKQIKLAIVSLVKQQYFPKGWTILQANDINQELMLVQQGEVDFGGQKKSSGFVFNEKGFFCRIPTGKKIVTNSFVTVWSISLRDLQELGKSCPKLHEKINTNIKVHSQ